MSPSELHVGCGTHTPIGLSSGSTVLVSGCGAGCSSDPLCAGATWAGSFGFPSGVPTFPAHAISDRPAIAKNPIFHMVSSPWFGASERRRRPQEHPACHEHVREFTRNAAQISSCAPCAHGSRTLQTQFLGEANRLLGVSAWTELTEKELDEVWERFFRPVSFRTGLDPADWPGIVEPSPSVTYRFEYPVDDLDFDNLHDCALAAFRQCLESGDRMYAIDIHHPSYWFTPHVPIEAWSPPGFWERTLEPGTPVRPADRWPVPVLPNGDYYIFLARDFSWGIFGHPWEQTMCVFGERLLAAFDARQPLLFRDVLRQR
jgi:hypothetical protein